MTNPGNRDYRDAILIQSSGVTFRNVRVRDVAWTAIRVTNGAAPVLDGVDVQGAGNVPFHFTIDAKPSLSRLSQSNNNVEGIWIDGGTVTGNQAWTYVGLPYHFTHDLALATESTLDLGPGTIFRMAPGAIFTVNGTLRVNGTETAPVLITARKDDSAGGDSEHNGTEGAAAPAAGDWEQIHFATTSGASVINHLEVRYAGMSGPGNRDYRDAILIQADVALRNVQVRSSAQWAVRIRGPYSPTLENIDVQQSGAVPFYFTLDAKPFLAGLSASNNVTEGIWIDGGTLVANQVWDYVGIPYHFTTDVTVSAEATLTLGQGTIFRMARGAALTVAGTLRVAGTAAAPVTLTSFRDDSAGGDSDHDGTEGNRAPLPGDWEQINFAPTAAASVIDHLEVRFAGMTAPGNRDYRDALLLQSAVTLRNVRVRDAAQHGVRIRGAIAPILQDVDVQRSGGVPYYFTLDAQPVLTRITASNNDTEGIWVDGGTLTADQTWGYVGLPYHLTTNISVPANIRLNLGPGTLFRMAPGAFFAVSGTLLAPGTEQAPIILTADKDDTAGGDSQHDGMLGASAPAKGDWESLIFGPGSDASVLTYTEVRYAGMTAPGNRDFRNAIDINGTAKPTLRNILIRNAASHGVRVDASDPVLENIDVRFADGVPFFFGLAANPVVRGLTGSENGTEGIWINGGTLTDTVRRWDLVSMPYLLTGDLRISNTASLTLGPGVILKMAPAAWIADNGRFITEGTLEAPVVITSQKDDSAGGDTFHDGSTGSAAPDPGDWEAIYFETGSNGSVLSYTDIRYGGETAPNNNDARTVIDIGSGLSPTLRNVRIRDSFRHAIHSSGSSTPVLQQVHVENSGGFPLLIDIASNPVLEGFTGNNNVNNAIYIVGGTLTSERTWNFGPLPLWIAGDYRVGTDVKLTIAPGTIIKMADAAWFAINGNLQAVGTADRPITFTSIHDDSLGGDSNGNGQATSPIRGSWETIYFEAGSNDSLMDHVRVRYLGTTAPNNNDARPAIDVGAALSPTFRHLLIEEVFRNGIEVSADAKPLLEDVEIQKVGGFPLTLAVSADPTIRNLSGTANANNAIYVAGGTIAANRAWNYGPLPIWLGGDLRIADDTRLTISPGTTIKVTNAAWITVNGSLQAVGSPDQPITFTALQDDSVGGDTNGDGSASTATPGNWEALYFAPSTLGSVLESVEIRFAGETAPRNNDRRPTISIDAAQLTLRNSRITQGAGIGIRLASDASLTLAGSLMLDFRQSLLQIDSGTATVTETLFSSAPVAIDIAATAAAKASVTGSAFLGISGNAVTHRGNDFAKALMTGNWWGHPAGPNDPSAADGRSNDNPEGALVSDYVDYSSPLGSRPAIPGTAPSIVGLSPSTTTGQFGAFLVTFSTPMDVATFGPDDFAITRPGGAALSVASITPLSTSVFRIQLATPVSTTAGTYTVRIGPNIANGTGLRLDQDADGLDGEAGDDVFNGTVVLDNTGPRIISQTPSGTSNQPIDSIVIEFNEPVAVDSFGPDDIRITTGTPPSGNVAGFRASTYLSRFSLSDLEAALTTLAGNWTQLSFHTVPLIDFGTGGRFTGNAPFPAGSTNFVVVYEAQVVIPTAGDWTFAVSSDDGYRLRVGGKEVAFTGLRGIGDPDLLTVNFAAPGSYALELVYFNAAGGSGVELSAAPGALTAFSPDFIRVGDASGGLAVTSPATPLAPFSIQSITALDPVATQTFPRQNTAFNGQGFLVQTAYGRTGPTSIATALALLNTPASQIGQTWANPAIINYVDNADGSFFTGNSSFPGREFGPSSDAIAISASAKVTIPRAGEWTFGVSSDDGFRLTVGTQTLEFDAPRATATSLATWTFDAPGEYDLSLIHFNTSGPSQVELFSAEGRHEAVNSSFRLVGDTSLGGLSVRSDPAPGNDLISGRTGFVATRFEIRFAPFSVNGTYRVDVAPTAIDAMGNPMNQDADTTNGEVFQDSYTGSFAIDRQPFRVLSTSPSPVANGALDQLDVTFSAAVQAGSFSASDVQIIGSLITGRILSVEALSPTVHRVRLDPITAEGNYEIRIGPGIADIAGNLLNQDLDDRGGEPEDRFITFIRVENTAPRVLDYSPKGTVGAGRTFFEITFTEPIQLASFTAEDITVTGPSGILAAPVSITFVTGSTYRVTYATPFTTGTHRIVLGPNITDAAGQPLDQDEDGVPGEPTQDQFANSFTIDATGPRVVSATPNDSITQALSQFVVEFSETMDPSSFTAADVRLTGPAGEVTNIGITRLSDTSFRLTFPSQSAHGDYTLTVGPGITDVLANPMDQNANGVTGEANDTFQTSVTVVLPDLVASDLVVPPTAQPGQVVTVTWRVTNRGNAAATAPWNEAVILSTTGSPAGASANVVVAGTFSSTSSLAPGEFIDRTLDVTVPITFSGAVTLFIEVDSSPKRVVEADENNFVSTLISVVVGPPPVDLTVTTVTSPPTGTSGGSMAVTWTVTNTGGLQTTATSWIDRVVLSLDESLDANDIVLGSVNRNGALGPSGTYSVTESLTLPESLDAGTYFVFVITDATDVVPEPGANANGNNATRSPTPLAVTAVPTPDLLVDSIALPPTAVLGYPLSVSWSLRNQGGAPTAGTWTDRVYLSADGNVQGAVLLGAFTSQGPLAAGQTATRTESFATPNLADGSYRVVVVTDATNQVFERNGEDNNTTASTSSTALLHIDLQTATVTSEGIPQAGQPLTVRWQVRNLGSATAPESWIDRVYLSIDTVLGNDVLLGEVVRSASLIAGGSYDGTLTTTLPDGTQGTYFLLAVADATTAIPTEGGLQRSNNIAASPAIQVLEGIYADLTVVTASGPNRVIGNPADITVSWTVRNDGRGPGPISNWSDRVVLSRDAIYGNSDDILLANVPHSGALPVGSTYSESRIFQLPDNLEGRFQIIVRTDAEGVVLQQPNTAPDIFVASQPLEVLRGPYADLVVESVTSPAAATNNQIVTLSWTVANRGIALTSTESWNDLVYFTTDPAGTTGLRLLGSFNRVGRLAVGEAYSRTVEVALPSDAAGTGYFVIATSGPYEGLFTDNNRRRSDPIAITFIPPPQSDLEIIRVTAPEAALDGASIDVSWTVRNNGPDNVANAWTDTVYLAPNGNLTGATVLGSFRIDPSLEAGKSYTRTIAFALPTKIQGVYSIIVRTDTGGAVDPTRASNNQLASGALVISLRSRPDLQVTSAFGPESVTAGTVIDVTWTVANLGASATPPGGSRWTDSVYLSLNNIRDGGDILLGSLPNGQALAPGQSYTSIASYKLPRDVAGNAFLLIVPDSSDAVDEVLSSLPDTYVVPIAIDAIPVPPPDLVVTQVTAPVEAFDGTSIVVRFSVENRGPGPTGATSWTDSIWLTTSKDRPDGNRGDVSIGSIGHSGVLLPGEGYETAITVRLPSQLRGQFYVTVWTDSGDRVFETALDANVNPDAPNDLQGSNFKAGGPISILLQPSADLVVTQVNAPPTAIGGSQVTLSWTVRNEGPIPTNVDRWVDSVYISTDPILGTRGATEFRVFAAPNFGTLLPGQSYTQTATFTLPPSAAGSYFIVQTNEDPNLLLNVEDTLFREVEAIIRRAEQELGRPLSEVNLADVRELTPGQLRRILTAPQSSRPETVFEGPFTNNNARSAESVITNTPADLVVTQVLVSPSVFSGESIDVTWTVRNDGAFAVFPGTRQWSDWILFSSEPTWNPALVGPLGSLIHVQNTPLLPGESYTATASFKIPEGIEGPRYIYVATDPNVSFFPIFRINLNGTGSGSFPSWPSFFAERVWEGETKANNVRGASTNVIYREADLFLVNASGPGQVDSSGTFSVQFTSRNDGTRATRLDRWRDAVYLSRDTTIDSSDKLIGINDHLGILQPGESYSGTIEAQLPDNIEGAFHLIVITNAGFGPGLGNDPTSFPGVLSTANSPMLNEYAGTASNQRLLNLNVRFVPGPDLTITRLTANDRVLVGQSFTATWTVRNSGAGAVPDRQARWTDSLYLSRDQFLDVRSDSFLGSFDHTGVLLPNEDYTVTANLSLPRGILGAYYVFVVSDPINGSRPRGAVVESNDTNNTRATDVPMLIDLPPPSDLQVDAVVGPSNASVGDSVSITLTVTNRGTETAKGSWFDTLYLSADGIWDYGDRLLGTVNPPEGGRTLAPGQGYTATLQVLIPPALPGSYRIIARTDTFNDIYEGPRDDNNLGVGADAIQVQVRTLSIGIPVSLELASRGQLFYRVEASAGETLEIRFESSSGQNELYVAYEAVPSSIQFDAAFEGALQASQTAVIPTTQAGTYYILIRSQGAAASGTLTARSLPFGITSLTPDTVGAGRYVTMTIRGARFDPQANVKLVRPQFGEYVPINYVVADATRIVAVFDLRDAPLGLYDIQVTNPNGEAVVIPYRFLISPPNSLDVSIGLGGPDEILLSKAGFPSAYYGVSLDSRTNLDTPYVYFQYGVPRISNNTFIPGERLLLQTNLQGSPNVAGVSWANLDPILNLGGVLTASGFAIDFRAESFDARTFALEIYPGLKALLAEDPNFLRKLSDLELEELQFEFYIFAAATPLTTEEFITFQRSRADALRLKILAEPSAPQALVVAAGDPAAFQDFYLQSLVRAGVLRYEDVPPSARITAEFDSNLAVQVAGLLANPDSAEFIANQTDALAAFFEQIRAWSDHDPNAFSGPEIPDGSAYNLQLSHPTRFEAFRIRVKVPDDFFAAISPNSGGGANLPKDPALRDFLNGPGGTAPGVVLRGPTAADSALNIVPGGSTRLPYLIQFANPADGQPVRELRVLQDIDTDLDVRSFQLTTIRFGDLTLGLPQGRGAYSAEFDLTSQRGYVLQMSAGIDVVTGIASWVFRAIDPVTGLLVSGENVGVLKPGETAEVSYTIRSRPEALSGASLDAQARVIFGDAAPIDTNRVTARLDNVAPTSTLTAQAVSGNRYLLEWSALDDALGSGVLQYSVYVSLDGRSYSALAAQTTQTTLSYVAPENSTPQFLVLAADVAGNLEAAPSGINLSLFPPTVRLGTVPVAVPIDREPLPILPPSTSPPANELFLQALLGVPGALPTARLPGFDRVLTPFSAASFARGILTSGAGVTAIGVALAPDGSLLVSGGAGRNQLFRIAVGGTTSAQAFATLDSPVFALAFDRDGTLWATTAGGSLLELDATSGAILERYSIGVSLGLAADPNASRLYVATGDGVQVFDTTRRTFTPLLRRSRRRARRLSRRFPLGCGMARRQRGVPLHPALRQPRACFHRRRSRSPGCRAGLRQARHTTRRALVRLHGFRRSRRHRHHVAHPGHPRHRWRSRRLPDDVLRWTPLHRQRRRSRCGVPRPPASGPEQ
jgi:subtilase family serine protease